MKKILIASLLVASTLATTSVTVYASPDNVQVPATTENVQVSATTEDVQLSASASLTTGTITGSNVNFRDAAGLNGNIIGTFNLNDSVLIYATVKASDGSTWYSVFASRLNKFGYVSATYVKVTVIDHP